MPSYAIECPACGAASQAKLKAEVTPIACPACEHVFMVQRPESVIFSEDSSGKKSKAKASTANKSKAKVSEAPVPPPPPPPPPPPLTLALLEAADDVISSAVIEYFAKSKEFKRFAKAEMAAIMARDAEDDSKLAEGIALAVDKGAVPPKSKLPLEPVRKIDVLGLTADEVAGTIIFALGDAPSDGCVLVLQGLSGTGKGTTVDKLKQRLPKCSTWSNGNIFRALTLLAVEYFASHGLPFTAEALSPPLLADLVNMLHFEQVSPKGAATPVFDVRIDGLGIRAMVSTIANTLLKEPRVSTNIPTVARMTQGEVIAFAAGCAESMRTAGLNVLMEGRSQTLDYVRTPFRFELTLSQPLIIGKRRAAQRIIGAAVQALRQPAEPAAPPPALPAVHAALDAALASCTGKA